MNLVEWKGSLAAVKPGLRGATVALFCSLAFVTAAEARRTAVDFSDPDNPMSVHLGGYCDLNGDDCGATYTLPYVVEFGGKATDKLLIRGDGILQFVGDATFGSGMQQFEVLATIEAGVNDATVLNEYGTSVFEQSAKLEIDQYGALVATWFTCATPQHCNNNPYTVYLTKNGESLDFEIDYSGVNPGFFPRPFSYGWYTPDDFDLRSQSGYNYTDHVYTTYFNAQFSIPARFPDLTPGPGPIGVPEPSIWAMMVIGFGALGAAIRRRTRVVTSA